MTAAVTPRNAGYFVQLDSLRAFAVLAVILSHTLDVEENPWSGYGAYGVRLFFVISGFLITGILIDALAKLSHESGRGRWRLLRSFYIRRALRIFPAYYLMIFYAAVISEGTRDNFRWYATYLSNWFYAFQGNWGVISHTWSLAVEEQFYLVWPLVAVVLSFRSLKWAIWTMILIGVGTRFALSFTDMWSSGVAIITPSTLDSLGLGCLLAWLWRSSSNVERWVQFAAAAGVVLLGVEIATGGLTDMGSAPTSIWWPLLCTWAIHRACVGFGGGVGKVVTWSPLLYLGRISYGIYLYHILVMPSLDILNRRTGIPMPLPELGYTRFLYVTAITIVVASLSFYLFERPINGLKGRFPYTVPPPAKPRLAE